MKKGIEAFVNAANEQELEAAWNNLSAEEQQVFEQLMEEDPPEDALAFFAQLYDDAPKEQASETVSISENEIYFKRQPLTEEQKKKVVADKFQFAVLVSSRVWGRHAPTRSCPKRARIFKN